MSKAIRHAIRQFHQSSKPSPSPVRTKKRRSSAEKQVESKSRSNSKTDGSHHHHKSHSKRSKHRLRLASPGCSKSTKQLNCSFSAGRFQGISEALQESNMKSGEDAAELLYANPTIDVTDTPNYDDVHTISQEAFLFETKLNQRLATLTPADKQKQFYIIQDAFTNIIEYFPSMTKLLSIVKIGYDT